jgi:LacI family transcriptional regulator
MTDGSIVTRKMTTLPRRPTQADVARVAGVSQALVSYVLNGKVVLAVPEETRQRIRDAIETLGYVPDRSAQSLRTRKTYTIACVIPDITNPFYPAFERGIQDVAEAQGYDFITYNTDGTAEKELKCLRSLQRGHVDGVIATLFHLKPEQMRPLWERDMAVVRFEPRRPRLVHAPLDYLYLDNHAAARAIVRYLTERGHTRIGMIAGQQGPRSARVRGYRDALASRGIPADETLIRNSGFTEQGGYQGMRELLALLPRPTAVFAANDLIALGALMAAREAGLSVPGDVALAGFDDIPTARLVSPALTTVAQSEQSIGRRAAGMVLERLNGAAGDAGRCEEMPYKLVVRESA